MAGEYGWPSLSHTNEIWDIVLREIHSGTVSDGMVSSASRKTLKAHKAPQTEFTSTTRLMELPFEDTFQTVYIGDVSRWAVGLNGIIANKALGSRTGRIINDLSNAALLGTELGAFFAHAPETAESDTAMPVGLLVDSLQGFEDYIGGNRGRKIPGIGDEAKRRLVDLSRKLVGKFLAECSPSVNPTQP